MEAESRTRVDDVDDVIELAAMRTADDVDTLSRAEVRAIGADVGLHADAIDGAIADLAQRRKAESDARVALAARARVWLGRVGIAFVAAAIVSGGLSWHRERAHTELRARLETAYAVVSERNAELASARARRAEVERIAGTIADPIVRDAERLGSANRVSVAERRLAVAVRDYESILAVADAIDVCGGPRAPCAVPEDDR